MTDLLDREFAGLGWSGAPPLRAVLHDHDEQARREVGLRLPRKPQPGPSIDDQGDLDTWWAVVSANGRINDRPAKTA